MVRSALETGNAGVKQKHLCTVRPASSLKKGKANPSILSAQSGWDINRGWGKLKDRIPSHGLSTTRWAARIAAVKPVAHHLLSVINAVSELSSLNLTAQARTEVQSIKKYISTLEFIVMSSMWVKLLTMIHETNLIIEARNATLDEEKDNIESLTNDIMQLREKWNAILSEAKLVAESIGITCEFSTSRNLPSQSDAEQHYRVNVFYVIVDSITSGLTRRFSSLQVICKLFGFLWKFNELSNEDLISAAKQFQEKYNNDVSIDLGDELVFLKRIYSTNFDTGSTPSPKVLLSKILELGLTSVFPNIVIALRIFVSLPASVASGERSFSVLKQIKNYSRSTMGQERLNGLAMIYINNDVAQGLDYSSVISTFAEKKARKALIH